MAITAVVGTWTFRDFQGRTAKMRAYIGGDPASATNNGQAAIAGTTPLLQAVSNAHVHSNMDAPIDIIYGTNAQYTSAQDKAVLIFQTAVGSYHRFQIPAPKIAEFLADQITVDKTETNMAALIVYILASFTDANKNALVLFVSGFYQRRRLPRRVGSAQKAPDGDIPAQ